MSINGIEDNFQEEFPSLELPSRALVEKQFELEKVLEEESKKIDFVADGLKEKYKTYNELRGFVDYLRGMEKLFIRVNEKEDQGDVDRIKEIIIKNEISRFAMDFNGEKEDSEELEMLFGTIWCDFENLCDNLHYDSESVEKIREFSKKLKEKYANHPECGEFIEYMQNVSLVFLGKKGVNVDMREIRESLLRKKMEELSADGDPEIDQLKEIRYDFEKELLAK